jgi:hypothetical protein
MNRLLEATSPGSLMGSFPPCPSCREDGGSWKYVKAGCIVPILI